MMLCMSLVLVCLPADSVPGGGLQQLIMATVHTATSIF